jgi:chromosome partitioning protein
MKIFVPYSKKGGVGKTKTATTVAEFFCHPLMLLLLPMITKELRGLITDLDPQGNSSKLFVDMEEDSAVPDGVLPPVHPDFDENDPNHSYDNADPERSKWDGRSSSAQLFFETPKCGILPYPTRIKNLDIMPAYSEKLDLAQHVKRSDVVELVHNRVHEFLSGEDVRQVYDFVVIDTPPASGPLTKAAIKAATHLVVPTLMEELPLQGLFGMVQLWKQESFTRDPNRPLEFVGVLPNMVRPINIHKDMLNGLKENPTISKYVMDVSLSLRAAFSEVDASGSVVRSVFDLPDNNPAKQEAIAVCEYIAKRVFANV